MGNSYFVDSNGLNSANVSLRVIGKMVSAAYDYDVFANFGPAACGGVCRETVYAILNSPVGK